MQKYIDLTNTTNYIRLKQPAEIIRNGGIVLFPTETVYGIGTNGLNETAIKKLFKIKQRPLNKPISLLVNSIDMINKIAKDITEIEYSIIKEFFPGPLTIVLKKKDIVPNILTANRNTVGIRMPSNDIALKLIEYTGFPIATSSANISSQPSGTRLQDITKDFDGKADYFIDGGPSKIGLSSTVIQVIDDIPHILRQGTVTEKQIRNACFKT